MAGPDIGVLVVAQSAFDGALNRIKQAERPKLDDAQRKAIVQSVATRLGAGASKGALQDEIIAVLRQTRQEQDATAAAQRSKDAGTKITAQAPGVTPTPKPGAPGTVPQKPADATIPPSQVLSAALAAATANPPQLTDPDIKGDMPSYRAALTEWQGLIGKLTTTLAAQQQVELGIATLPDGTLIDTHDPRVQRDPNLQSQLAAAFADQDKKAMDAYYGILNDLDLKDYASKTAATNVNNQALSQGFQNALSAITQKVSIGEANQNTAVRDITRQLSGMAESRARASETEDELLKTQGLAGPAGKTAYGPGDFGAAGEAAARYAGLPRGPGNSVLNFTGQRTVDPAGLMAAGDQALGVTGALAQIPGLGVDQSQVPTAPTPQLVGAAPTLRRPGAPVLPQRNIPPPPTGMQLAPFLEDRINGGG